MPIPTEAVGSVPRSASLQAAIDGAGKGSVATEDLEKFYDDAVKTTMAELESTGSPILTDGEQTKPSFVSYPLAGLDNLDPNGILISFDDGHDRQLPKLTKGPFRYGAYAGSYLERAKRYTSKPLKQAVISASAMSLLYPAEGIEDYPKEAFLEDLVQEAVKDIRSCFDGGAEKVQIDFTEGRLAVKLDPSKGLLKQFIDLNNLVLSQFSKMAQSNTIDGIEALTDVTPARQWHRAQERGIMRMLTARDNPGVTSYHGRDNRSVFGLPPQLLLY